MGRFDGVLIASDWDGTLAVKGKIPEENIKAIRYFQENGGKFTICSGRYFKYLMDFRDVVRVNTYTIAYNGAYIIDTDSGECLYEGFCDEYLFDILKELLSRELHYKTIALYDNENPVPYELTVSDFLADMDAHRSKKLYKVLLRSDTPEHAKEGVTVANSLELRDYIAVRSWEISLEILKRENAKGAAIRRVADKIGARLVVGIGDYENDITLLDEADIGYAVEDAIPELLPYATRRTVSAAEGAVAAVIYELDKELS